MAGKSTKTKELNLLAKAYLRIYNLAQVLGWSQILYLLLTSDSVFSLDPNLWKSVKVPVFIFQNAAILEVLHASIGLVKSNPLITLMQITSRVVIVCGVLFATPESYAASSAGLPLALLAWSVTEIIRYSYYFMNLMGFIPSVLTWLRYTTFIVLYPIGITGELLCAYAAQSYGAAKPNALSYTLPNDWNFTFCYRYFILIFMLIYIPAFPQLYLHMFSQRKKVLGPMSAAKTK